MCWLTTGLFVVDARTALSPSSGFIFESLYLHLALGGLSRHPS
jgi:hypothetical protein